MLSKTQNLKKVLLFDNYDSFTFNLVQIIHDLQFEVDVVQYDKITSTNIENYFNIMISPGPDLPENYPFLLKFLENHHKTKNILGICLGHQAIAEFFGCKLINFDLPFHGIQSKIQILDKSKIFKGLPDSIEVGRYHSWLISNESIPSELIITAQTDNNEIMGISHNKYSIHGVQFHPESIMTEFGHKMILNWLENY